MNATQVCLEVPALPHGSHSQNESMGHMAGCKLSRMSGSMMSDFAVGRLAGSH